VLYISDEFTALGNTPFMLINAISKAPVINIDASEISPAWKTCYFAISSIDRENNESKLSNPVQLIKTNKGWSIPK
jgi:hypothetical protein